MIEGLVVAAAVGLLTAALTGPALRWIPEVTDAPDKTPYRELPTAHFVTGCGLLSTASAATAWFTLPHSVQPMWWVLSSSALLLAVVDARTTWLPLRLTRAAWLMMTVAAVGSALWGDGWPVLVRGAVGAAVAGLLYWLLSARGGFAFGDVRFAPLLGAASAAHSWPLLFWTLAFGTVVGGVHGAILLLQRRREGFPYAPSMLAGAYLASVALALPR